ncbi:MAG: GntR family transcriptional regulator [Nitrospirae bacterium]|nr:GntR family transcriptional regulator [Nitrospirota bacterium]
MFTDESVDRESRQKLYVQLLSILKGKIDKGEWLSGEKIPAEDDLCRSYNVSKATVRIAVAELVRDGLLKRWQGKGTFVANLPPRSGMAMKTRLTEDMFGKGVSAERELISRGIKSVPDDIRRIFRDENEIYHIVCRRVVDDDAAYMEESFITPEMLPGIEHEDVSGISFYSLVQERAARRVARVVQTIEGADISAEAALILDVDEGSPGIMLHRLLAASDSSPIAYTRLVGSGRKYRIQTEFERLN